MDLDEAVELISEAVPREAGVWAELGAGEGTFVRGLARLLGPGAQIYAVDRDPRALAKLERWAQRDSVTVIPVTADFTRPLDLPGLGAPGLDGLLFANSLHFVPRPEAVLERLAARLRPGGSVVIIEYDRSRPSRWVPYPIPAARLPALAAGAGLATPTITATRPSAFGGILYAAATTRLGEEGLRAATAPFGPSATG